MANVTVDAAADIAIGARVVIRDSNDFVYVLVNAGGNIRAYKGNVAGEPTSFAEQDAVGAPNSADLVGIAAAIDSAGLIHVMYYFDDTVAMQAAPNIRYAQFRTSAHVTTQDDWVLINEEISAMTNSEGDFPFTHLLGIAIDANDDPHATWNDEINDMGSGKEIVFYDNRIGGTWGGRIEVERQTATADIATSLDLMIADPASSVNADRPIIILTNISDSAVNVFHGTTLNATAFTKASDVTGTIVPSSVVQRGKISIAIDSNEKITATFIENTSNDLMIVEHLNSSVWGTWETPVDVDTTQDYGHPSIAIDGTNRYIFVEHVNDNDIHLWKDVGAGFVEETVDADLPNVGTFDDVKCKWASKNNNSSRELDYVFEDSGGAVLYNTFQGAALAPPIIQIADEILEHVDSGLAITGPVKIGIDVLEHVDSAIKVLGVVKIGSDILDHVEGALRFLALVRIGSDILDHVEVPVRVLAIVRLGDEVLERVESALAILPVVLVKIADEILDHVESAIKIIVQKGIGIFGRRSLDKIRSMDKG